MNALSDTVRTFVAIDIGEAVRASLTAEMSDLRRRWPDIKWVEPENLHLTLSFLGYLYPEHVAAAGEVLAGVAAEAHPFELTVAGLGCYGPQRSPRVIWVGATAGADLLKAIQARQADGLRQIGLTPETRPFSPHLTLGRVKAAADAAGLGEWLRAHADRSYGIVPVGAIRLMRSELRPEGALYSTLKTAVLSGQSLSRG
jgi:2'-5' RNA ligase